MPSLFLSHTLSLKTPMYGGREGLKFHPQSRIEFPLHFGTHVDAPKHFVKNGLSVCELNAEAFVFSKVSVLEVPLIQDRLLEFSDLSIDSDFEMDSDMILLKTGAGALRGTEDYYSNYPGISEECANQLRQRFLKLKGLGLDSISLSAWRFREVGRRVHQIMLGGAQFSAILVIEDMKLAEINRKTRIKKVIVLPLRVEEADGGPCTVLAELY